MNTLPLSSCFFTSHHPLADQLFLGKRKTVDYDTSKASTDEKIKKSVTFGCISKCYFFQNVAPNKFAVKVKNLTKEYSKSKSTPIEELDSHDLKRFNPSYVWMLKHENSLFKPIKSLLEESLTQPKKQHLLEMMFLRLYLSVLVKESVKDMQNLNIIDDQENEWVKAWVEAIALNLTLQFNHSKKIQMAIEWINKLIPDEFLPELKQQLLKIAENIPDLYMQASSKSRSMIYPQFENEDQIPSSDASCFWVRFLSLNPHSLPGVHALFIKNPSFFENIQHEIACLTFSNAINFSCEFELNIQYDTFHKTFPDFFNLATTSELDDFFNRCLMKDPFLAKFFPLGLNFIEVLDCFERIHKGINGRFIEAIVSHSHPNLQLLQERMHIDHAFSFLHDLDQIKTTEELKEKLTLSLSHFPFKKKQTNGPSVLFIDKDVVANSLSVNCLENRSSQGYYFWKKLFTLYPHYKKNESIKHIFSVYLSQCNESLKQSLKYLLSC